MLTPVFKDANEEQKWKADNVLDLADTFWINNWASKYVYQTVW